MDSVVNDAQITATSEPSEPIDLGFRWYEIHFLLENLVLILVCRIEGIHQWHLPLAPNPDHTLDISIELTDMSPDSKMQLKISADVKEQKYGVRRDGSRTIRWVSKRRM